VLFGVGLEREAHGQRRVIDVSVVEAGLEVRQRRREAQKARPKTVVYVAKGSEAQAKALAALLPGGAAVEPLTWKVNASVVIAVGASFTQ